ncbi:X-linked retinitis pigmentosa GTPase regulator-like [Macrosteles quadrilineatus]|uniref:X-linked retinitis pigmentosa GTPase regulator-like n=1 Tax=Macrosteles quadrilineatus TaxID=74068 RepID=UPI0023E1A61D|nr:X-linked retinitis pigmentosa GTPase regulator-like [Macrosteles quadrilineatus]
MTEEEKEIPASGAVFTFGRSRFADNIPSHFFIKNDPIVDVDCGDEHTAVVCQNGRVFVFGSNEWGQLGLGHKSVVAKPSCIKSLKPEQATHVACGRAHTLISTASGKLFVCGSNSDGQLGVGDTTDRDVPTVIDGVEGTIEQLSAGCLHSAVLNSKGEVFVWGSNSDGQLGLGEDVKSVLTPTRLHLKDSVAKISCGYYHTVLLTEEGQVYVCGEGEGGKLGLGVTESVRVPTVVSLDAWPISITAGGNHTFVVAVDGKVYGWGSNLSGQLGLSTNQSEVNVPTLIDSLADKVIKEVACGESHTAFVTELGELFTCGETRHGKLGCENPGSDPNCVSEPTRVSRFKPFTVTKVRCGGCHTMVLAAPRTDDIDDHLSNGHISNTMLQPPEVDITSPPMRALPPLQRTPHLNYISEDKVSRQGSAGLVPELSVENASENGEVVDGENGDNEKLSIPKSTPETVSINEKTSEVIEEDNKSIVTLKEQQAYDEMKTKTVQAVTETCEIAVTKAKSAVEKNIAGENGLAKKLASAHKKSKMCTIL